MPRADQLTDPVAEHGEGPVWSRTWGGLRWVDMLAGDVLTLDAPGNVARTHVGSIAAALRPRARGGAVIAVERGFAFEETDGSLTHADELWTDPSVRMNEGSCDPDGRFYCGSMHYDGLPRRGALFRLDVEGSVRQVFDGTSVSNGLDWSEDGATAYYVDSATQRIDVFDYDFASGLTGRRPFISIDPADGTPDGLTVDRAGGVWLALFGGSCVRRYTDRGRLDLVVDVPVSQVTACAFGGPGLDRLFITTSRHGLPASSEPNAGALFACDVGVVGQPVRPYAG